MSSPSAASGSAVTWPIFRPGCAALPYRCTLTPGSAAITCVYLEYTSRPVAADPVLADPVVADPVVADSVLAGASPPNTLAITTCGAIAFGAPSGRSSTARRCCSNWDVLAPSMVQ